MRPATLALLVPILLAACGGGAPPETAPSAAPSDQPLSLRIPRTIAGWRFVNRQDYDNPSLGLSVRYRHSDSLTADLYLYPGPGFDDACDHACARDLLKSEMDTNVAMFKQLERDGRFESIVIDGTRDLTPSRADRWRLGSHMRMWVVMPGATESHRSHLWLVYAPRVKMKVRATFIETPVRAGALESFLAAVVPTVTSPAPPRDERPLPKESSTDAIFSLLEGVWDWEMSNGECERGMHNLVAAPDRKSIRLRVVDEPEQSDAHATYRVLDAGPDLLPGATHVLRLEMEGEDRRGADGALVTWDMVFRSRDRYHWRRSDWPPDGETDAIIRCDSKIRG